MSSTREMRMRILSIKNIAQVTKALETVSASKVRRSTQVFESTRPYSEKAWNVLLHLAGQSTSENLHPLLAGRQNVRRILVLMLSSDRGLAGAYNINVVRNTLEEFNQRSEEVAYLTVGRKGRDFLVRRRKDIIAEFSNLPSPPSFIDVSPIGRIAVEGYQNGEFDEVYLSYTQYINMVQQNPVIYKLLPLDIKTVEEDFEKDFDRARKSNATHQSNAVFIYEPDETELLQEIVPRFVSIQIYQSILSAQASEHAARMVAMRNASDNAKELINILQLEYNKIRQQAITNDMLDIVGGVEALAQSR